MEQLQELKELWLQAATGKLPDAAAMWQLVRQFRRKKLRKIIMICTVAFACVCILAGILWQTRENAWSTQLGAALMLLAGVLLLLTNLNSLSRFYRLRPCSNQEYVQFLERTRVRQLFFYRYTQVAGLISCSAGLLLYVFEAVAHALSLALWVYGGLAAYLLLIWLVLRPRAFRRGAEKLDEEFEKLKTLQEQLKNEEI